MAIETMLKQDCKLCGNFFDRPRKALDTLGVNFEDMVCPDCVKAMVKEDEKPKPKKKKGKAKSSKK